MQNKNINKKICRTLHSKNVLEIELLETPNIRSPFRIFAITKSTIGVAFWNLENRMSELHQPL